MHRRQFLYRSAAAAVAAFSGCSESPSDVDGSGKVEERFGGKESLHLLTNPDQVLAYRLVDSEGRKSIDEYETAGDPVVVPKDSATKLGKLLGSSRSYLWDVTVSCPPDYGIRVQFSRGEKSLDVLFCFRCKSLLTYVDGKQVSGALFKPIEAQLATIMKSLFPKDTAIQKL